MRSEGKTGNKCNEGANLKGLLHYSTLGNAIWLLQTNSSTVACFCRTTLPHMHALY